MWYMVKCFYLLLSAYQIRSGYPTRILGNFLCKGYNYINFGLFKGFMFVPFLFEIRTIMDWIWTDTSMTIFDWLKMEDIFANIFLLKVCQIYKHEIIIIIIYVLSLMIFSVADITKVNFLKNVELKNRVSLNTLWVVHF